MRNVYNISVETLQVKEENINTDFRELHIDMWNEFD
jgi:hypothetical protein